MKLLVASCVCLLLPLAILSATENEDGVPETNDFSDHEANKRSSYGFGLGKRTSNKYAIWFRQYGFGKRQSFEEQVRMVHGILSYFAPAGIR